MLFVKKCAECGVDVPYHSLTLPYEEQDEILTIIDKTENAPVFIELVSTCFQEAEFAKIVKTLKRFCFTVYHRWV